MSPSIDLSVDPTQVARRVFICCLLIEVGFVLLDYHVNYGRLTEVGAMRRLTNIAREDSLASWFGTRFLGLLVVVSVLAIAVACGSDGPTSPSATPGSSGSGVGPTSVGEGPTRDSLSDDDSSDDDSSDDGSDDDSDDDSDDEVAQAGPILGVTATTTMGEDFPIGQIVDGSGLTSLTFGATQRECGCRKRLGLCQSKYNGGRRL